MICLETACVPIVAVQSRRLAVQHVPLAGQSHRTSAVKVSSYCRNLSLDQYMLEAAPSLMMPVKWLPVELKV